MSPVSDLTLLFQYDLSSAVDMIVSETIKVDVASNDETHNVELVPTSRTIKLV